jgi:hypothetical protein
MGADGSGLMMPYRRPRSRPLPSINPPTHTHTPQGFKAARAHAETVLTLLEIMSFQSKFPCFVQTGPQKAINAFKQRLLYGQTLTDQQVTRLVDGLVRCVGSRLTRED